MSLTMWLSLAAIVLNLVAMAGFMSNNRRR